MKTEKKTIFCPGKSPRNFYGATALRGRKIFPHLPLVEGSCREAAKKYFLLPADGVSFQTTAFHTANPSLERAGCFLLCRNTGSTPLRSERWAMAKSGQARNIAKWRTCGAATLLVTALAGFADTRAGMLSGLDRVTANSPGEILEQPAVSRVTTPARPRQESSLAGNPLWGVPLSALQETRARPIFSPSRRPPAPPVVAAPQSPPPKPPVVREPEVLKLTLLGTVIGVSDRIGLFVDETSKDVIRIRTGESHAGWTLRSLHRHSANFEKGHQETTLAFPTPGSEQRGLSAGAAAAKPSGASLPAAPVAPIIPVSAPATRSAQKVRQETLSIPATN